MTEILNSINGFISPWVYGPVVFVVWLIVLNIIRKITLSKLKRFSEHSSFAFGNSVLDASRFPIALLILASGIYVLDLLLPWELKVQRAALLLVKGTVVLSIILFLDRLFKEFITRYSDHTEIAFISKGLLHGLIRGVVIGLGLLVLLDLLGISITPILASLGIGSLAVALALQDTLSNFFAGIYITLDQPVREGDFVRLEGGQEGYIKEVGWRSTRIQLIPDKIIIVPNQKLISTIITNFHMPTREINVPVPIGVHYDSDLKKVEEVTLDVARQIMKTVPGAIQDFEPLVRYTDFSESSILFNIVLRVKEFGDQHLLKHEFIKALHERFKKEGIIIPYPTRTLDIPAATFEALKNR